MSDDMRLELQITGSDLASGALRSVGNSIEALERQARELGETLKKALGSTLLRQLVTLRAEGRGFGDDMAEAGQRTAKALRADLSAAVELRDALREIVSEQRRVARPPQAPSSPVVARPASPTAADLAPASGMIQGRPRAAGDPVAAPGTAAASGSGNPSPTPENAVTRRARASRDALREVGRRWSLRSASEAAERHEVEQTAETWNRAQRRRMAVMDRSARIEARRQREESSRAAAQSRAEATAADRRVGNIGRAWRMRERSEAAEARHVATMRREREAVRRGAVGAGRHAYGHARHAIRSVNHPVHESLGFALTAGAAFGTAAAEHIVKASEAFDTSMARLKMFAPGLDADAIRRQALRDSIALGVDASKIVDTIAESVRDGVPPAIAESLPKSIVQTAQVMGGDIEKLTDSLAEGIQESTAMGWIKDKPDARRFLNLEAGLSTTAGNTSAKTEQFIAAGGLGHGKEMGLDLEKTMAYGAMLNASGSRTGQASARFMGQLSQNTPKMVDKFRQATESHKNTEEDRAVRSAPHALGYAGIREMQAKIMAGPEGLIDFATRLQKLDDKARKLTLEGYGFSEQGGAMLAELGSNGGAKGRAVLERAHELAGQTEANDYLSQKFAEWSKSLAFMLQQIEAGWHAIENEVGDVFKSDLIAPFRDWWVQLASTIVGSGLRERVHGALMGFVHGLGFDDFRAVLAAMTANAHGFDLAGFAHGVGEGVRAIVDNVRSLAGLFGGAGGLSAETVGRLATEFLGLSLALRFVAPVVSTVGGIVSAFLALKAALQGAALISELTGLSGVLNAIVGAEIASSAAGLLSFAGALGIIGAAVQGLISAGLLNRIEVPHDMSAKSWDRFAWGSKPDGTSARPAWVDKLFGSGDPGPIMPDVRRGPHGGVLPRYATGGLIRGAGTGTSDSIIAAVSNREFVVNAAATGRNLPLLEALNAGAPMPAFATGGHVGGLRASGSTITAGPSAAGAVIVSAMLDTERGFASVRVGLETIADLLRQEARSSAILHGEVVPVDSGVEAIRAMLAQFRADTTTLRPASTTSDSSAGASGFGPGSGRANLRFGRQGTPARGGTPNMRYGRDGSGRARTTPGSGEAREIGPRVGLGKMGAKFASKAPVIMDGLMKKYGLTREQAAGVVGNLGHESGGFTKYHEGGQAAGKGGVGWAQWTGPRRRQFEAWTKAHGLNPTSDEASWRYLTEGDPETAGAIAAVKGTNNRADATRAWHDKFERSADISHGVIVKPKSWNSRLRYADQAFAAQPSGATVEAGPSSDPAPAGSAASAVDRALKMPGANAQQASAALGHAMHLNAWCADFVNANLAASGLKGSGSAMAASFSGWGHHVDNGAVQKGDVITENRHGDRVNHVGFATGEVQRDRSGNVTAVQMVSGNFGGKVATNWERVGIIADIRRSNQAVETAARKVIDQAKPAAADLARRAAPADIARQVRPHGVPTASATVPGNVMASADNSTTTIHAPVTVHLGGHHDPHHVGRTVAGHVSRLASRYTDSDATV